MSVYHLFMCKENFCSTSFLFLPFPNWMNPILCMCCRFQATFTETNTRTVHALEIQCLSRRIRFHFLCQPPRKVKLHSSGETAFILESVVSRFAFLHCTTKCIHTQTHSHWRRYYTWRNIQTLTAKLCSAIKCNQSIFKDTAIVGGGNGRAVEATTQELFTNWPTNSQYWLCWAEKSPRASIKHAVC